MLFIRLDDGFSLVLGRVRSGEIGAWGRQIHHRPGAPFPTSFEDGRRARQRATAQQGLSEPTNHLNGNATGGSGGGGAVPRRNISRKLGRTLKPSCISPLYVFPRINSKSTLILTRICGVFFVAAFSRNSRQSLENCHLSNPHFPGDIYGSFDNVCLALFVTNQIHFLPVKLGSWMESVLQ